MSKIGSFQALTIVYQGSPLTVEDSVKLSALFDRLVTAGTKVKIHGVSSSELTDKKPEVKVYPGDESIRVIGETLNTKELSEDVIIHLINYAYFHDKTVANAVKKIVSGAEFDIHLANSYNLGSERVLNAIALIGK